MVRWPSHFTAIVLVAVAAAAAASQSSLSAQGPPPRAPRDRQPPRPAPQAIGTAHLSGRVAAADTGRPVRRARVALNGAPGGSRVTTTDDEGRFEFRDLPAGRYTLSASKTGFINIAYGQRRPRQAGTPLQIADGQELAGLDLQLPRGSVISGHVLDETGEALPGASVSVLRYDYVQGYRQLIPAGGGETDDQGAYRIWGLNPGTYYITAATRNAGFGVRTGLTLTAAGGFVDAPPVVWQAEASSAGVQVLQGANGVSIAARAMELRSELEQTTYAPTYYPGVTQASEAQAITLGLSAEASNVDFGILLVSTVRLTGLVSMSDGAPLEAATVVLAPDGAARRGPGSTHAARVSDDGSFTIPNVPPGRYVLRARGGSRDAPQFAVEPITIAEHQPPLTIVLAPGATLAGTVRFEGTGQAPDASQLRVVASSADASIPGVSPVARVDRQGHFTLTGLPAGEHWIRAQSPLRGWMLTSVLVNGRETIDEPLEVRGGQAIDNVSLVFSDRLTEVNGTLTDDRQQPVTDYTVLAFPTDESRWRPQSRHILTARPDQNGRFQIRGLPIGTYYLVPIDPVEQGEWFDPEFLQQHRQRAATISVGAGSVRTQDFRLTVQ